jgi:hypothetical protein
MNEGSELEHQPIERRRSYRSEGDVPRRDAPGGRGVRLHASRARCRTARHCGVHAGGRTRVHRNRRGHGLRDGSRYRRFGSAIQHVRGGHHHRRLGRASRPKSRQLAGAQDPHAVPPPSSGCRVRGVMRSRRSPNARPAASLTGSYGESWRAWPGTRSALLSRGLSVAHMTWVRAGLMDSYEFGLPRELGRGNSDLQHPMGDVGRDS